MNQKKPGDTLVEVLFAFAILSLVISVMFSGAMSSFKSAIAAQERTQALFVAQYQADALKTYRDSLEWDASSNNPNNYLDGNSNGLIQMRTVSQPFCMQFKPAGTTDLTNYWAVITSQGVCSTDSSPTPSIARTLAPNLINPEINITTSLSAASDSQTAIVEVSWLPRNSSVRERVINTILLTKQR